MTLVVARKFKNLIVLCADTFSENTATGEQFNWYSEPIRKVFALSNRFWIGFSDNSHQFLTATQKIRARGTESIAEIASIILGHANLEALVVDRQELRLFEVKRGNCLEVDVGYVGSKSGFEVFQRERHERSASDQTLLQIVEMPEELHGDERGHFGAYVAAFFQTLLGSDGTFGGVPIVWTCTSNKAGFSSSATLSRNTVLTSELRPNKWMTIPFQDEFHGGYLTSVWGSENTSVIYFPEVGLGFTHDGALESGVDYIKHERIDGYEFSRRCAKMGCAAKVSFGDSFENRARKLEETIAERRIDFSYELLRDAKAEVVAGLCRLNADSGLTVEEPEDILTKDTVLSFSQPSQTLRYLQLKSQYHAAKGESLSASAAHKDFCSLKEQLDGLRFQFRHVPMLPNTRKDT